MPRTLLTSTRTFVVGLVALLSVAAIGCGGGPLYAALPRTVVSAVREDYPECRRPHGFELEREPSDMGVGHRYEVRSCGIDAVYVCPRGIGGRDSFCVREQADDTSGGMEPVEPSAPRVVPSPADRAHAASIVRLLNERDDVSLDLPIATTVAGPLLVVGGLTLGMYEALRGYEVGPIYCGTMSSCAPRPPRTVFPDAGLEVAGFVGAGLGALLTLVGGIWIGASRDRRSELMDEVGTECRGIRFGAGPGLVGLGAELCFP